MVSIYAPSPGSPLVGTHVHLAEKVNDALAPGTNVSVPVSVVLRNPWGVDWGNWDSNPSDGLVTVTGDQLAASTYHNGNAVQSAWLS